MPTSYMLLLLQQSKCKSSAVYLLRNVIKLLTTKTK